MVQKRTLSFFHNVKFFLTEKFLVLVVFLIKIYIITNNKKANQTMNHMKKECLELIERVDVLEIEFKVISLLLKDIKQDAKAIK